MNTRRKKVWIKVPPGRHFTDEPSEGGVEHHEVSVVEPPICHEKVPPLVNPNDPEGDRECDRCRSRWLP